MNMSSIWPHAKKVMLHRRGYHRWDDKHFKTLKTLLKTDITRLDATSGGLRRWSGVTKIKIPGIFYIFPAFFIYFSIPGIFHISPANFFIYFSISRDFPGLRRAKPRSKKLREKWEKSREMLSATELIYFF